MAGKAQNFTQRQHMLRPGYEIFRYCDSELGEVSLHHHDFYEIYLFLNGSVEYSIESRIYRLLPGDILLIGPMELHQPRIAKDHGPYERMVLWLDKRYLEQLSTPQTSLTRCFDASAPGHTNLLRLPPAQRAESQTLMERLAAESEGAQAAAYGSDVVARACLLQLLAGLNRFALAARARHEVEDKAGPVVAEVLHYINEHYPDELSLDLLSAKFFISKYHLSHEFHRLVGTSVYRYIIQKRLVIAKQMLANGVAPTDVYGHCGFGDYANFYRAFKAEYHISPKQFLGRAGNENTFGG